MYKIAVLASTNGTDLQAIIDEMEDEKMKGIELSCVISNKKDAYALERAKKQGFKTYFVDPKDKTREEFDKEMGEILHEHGVELVCLIGYMKLLSTWFVNEFKNHIINVHPALLPKFSGSGFYGANVHEAVLEAKETETGCTIHIVTEDCDEGPIIIQGKVPVEKDDTADDLKNKVQALEKKLYPEVIRKIASGNIDLNNL